MFGTHAWRLGRFGGVEIKIDPSWSFIAFLVGYSFTVILDDAFPDHATQTLVTVAVLMTVAFFASVLLHELAHSWVSKARGIEVRGITLFLFGGATHADLDAESPTDELVISAVGPLTSLAIAGAFWGLAVLSGDTLAGYATGRLGWINLALAVFNLVPGFPLDGGRILRSLVWLRTNDLLRATRIAARGGQSFGYVLIALGILELLLAGSLIGGLWFIAIGWFLAQTAQAAFLQLRVRHMLADVPAWKVMTTDIIEIPAETTIQQAIDDYFLRRDFSAFPVRAGDETVGIITLPRIKRLPREVWSQRLVGQEVVPLSEECTVGLSTPMDEVLDLVNANEAHRVLVLDAGTVRGIITARNVVRWMEQSEALGLTESATAGRRT